MSRVHLYVYDLSGGLAHQLSLSLLGKQIDGIWHTSVVVFGREIFYGRGIQITPPGASQHGQPLRVLDMGETALDEGTFDEYLMEMENHYSAEKYHLLDFNCNSFTSDCVGFLTGGTIPSWIKDLPSDFLSTDFGRTMRSTIDRMYSVPTSEMVSSPGQSASTTSLRPTAEGATTPHVLRPGPYSPELSPVVSPIHVSTNLASFQSILTSHRAVVAFFTSASCGPCHFIEPTFEEIAQQKTKGMEPGLIAFIKVDIQVGAGHQLASQYSVRATPTFMMFINQRKKHEMRGVNAPELRTQIDMLLHEAFPAHPHSTLSLPYLEAVSTEPIVFGTTPLDAIVTKLSHFVDCSGLLVEEKARIKDVIDSKILPFLKLQVLPFGKSTVKPLSFAPILTEWTDTTKLLISALPIEQLFPVVDLWRIGFLSTTVGMWVSEEHSRTSGVTSSIIFEFLKKAELNPLPRSFVLTLLKCLSNALGTTTMSRQLLTRGPLRKMLTEFVISQLLGGDNQVKTMAANLIFNVASRTQAGRKEVAKNDSIPQARAEADDEWEIEILSAIVESIRCEENEETLHRLVASLGFLLLLSPVYENQLSQLLEILQVRKLLQEKATSVAKKTDIIGLIFEVSVKLCS